jgi:putative membrane protein
MTALAARPHVTGRVSWKLLPLVLAGALVLTAIAYPLTSGAGRDAVTWAIVLLGAAVSVLHAALAHGARTGVAVLVVVVGCAVLIEALGLATGFPYGRYSYGPRLGPTVLGVPFLVPLAWLMMAWPSRLLAERLATGRAARVLVAAAVFAAWDVVLDPQMVQAGYWTWAHPRPGLPGIDTVPLTNLAGWLLAGLVLMALLEAVVARTARRGPPGVGAAAPLLVLGWMTLGGALAHAGWLDLPGSAAWGVLLAVPVLVTLVVRRRRASRR